MQVSQKYDIKENELQVTVFGSALYKRPEWPNTVTPAYKPARRLLGPFVRMLLLRPGIGL